MSVVCQQNASNELRASINAGLGYRNDGVFDFVERKRNMMLSGVLDSCVIFDQLSETLKDLFSLTLEICDPVLRFGPESSFDRLDAWIGQRDLKTAVISGCYYNSSLL